jgi:hypothetical protein
MMPAEVGELSELVGDLQPGDILLTTTWSPLSRAIAIFSGSPYSHAVLCAGGSVGWEAMDQPYNASESGGGIRRIDIPDVLLHPTVRRIAHLRPHEPPSEARLLSAIENLRNGDQQPPTFATAGIVLYRASQRLSAAVADKSRTVTCSEFVTRALEQAGVNLGFEIGLLHHVVADVSPSYDIYQQPDTNPTGHGVANGEPLMVPLLDWPKRAVRGVLEIVPTIRRRTNNPYGGDQTDFITPAHLLTCRALRVVRKIERPTRRDLRFD